MKHTVVVLSDEHAGYKLGMLNPASELIEGPYKPTASQELLWKLKTAAARFIANFAGKSPITILHLGDPAHGLKYPTELVSTAPVDQIRIAVANWEPLLALPNLQMIRCATSTEAHSMGESSTDHLIADQLKLKCPNIDIKVTHHGTLTAGGFVIDYAHHGPGPGSRTWLEGNIARFYLTDIILRCALSDTRVPDLVLRGHTHSPIDEVVRKDRIRSRIITVPALCMPGRHAIQVTKSVPSCTVGLYVFAVENGKMVDEKQLYLTIDLRDHDRII